MSQRMSERKRALGTMTASLVGALMTVGVLLAPMTGHGQAGSPKTGAAELLRAIERLAVVGNVLYVAAHPDDENTRLLAYVSGEELVRTAYLSLTRGDGGQNLIGAEQGPLLGLIRTQELLAARRVDGGEQFFTRARDFGYSKTPTETLAIWNREAVLTDAVWVIRQFRPDVIITRFPTQGLDTHGHHTASAILAEEALRAAADPGFAKEQLQTVGVWQAKRLFWNRSPWGRLASDDLSKFVKLDVGGYNPVLGVSYGELAADSRSMHKSQGFGSARSRGPSPEYFLPLYPQSSDGKLPQSLFEGIDRSWRRVPGGEKLALTLAQAAKEFDPRRPSGVIPTLLRARAELSLLPDSPWKAPKLRELDDVILGCAGLHLDSIASDYVVVPGEELKVTLSAIVRAQLGASSVRIREIKLPGAGTVPIGVDLSVGVPWQLERSVAVAKETEISNPYWLSAPPDAGMYRVAERDKLQIGQPENLPSLPVEFVLDVRSSDGKVETLRVMRSVLFKWTDPVAGERLRSIEVTPKVMVNVDAQVLMFTDATPRPLRVRLKAGQDKVAGELRLSLPTTYVAEPKQVAFSLASKGEEQEVLFQVRHREKLPSASLDSTLTVEAIIEGQTYSRGLLRIEHPHIPIQTLFPSATVKLVGVSLQKTRKKIGYIAGAGDEVAAALKQVGFDVTLLSEDAILRQPLGQYGAIVIGVRAYNVNPRLPFYREKLMQYVSAGGNLVVQYNTSNRLGKLTVPIGPQPFEITTDRVTDENAEVKVLLPGHPILEKPNKITATDFAGWVQERGLYFADKWDAAYQAPLGMHDPGEPERRGSLIVARHGKGSFVYTGLSFFRQLPAGVPGAFRLFANLISQEP